MDAPARVANIINFIRAVEPRLEMDLVEPVERQIELLVRHKLPGTWLLQYDALTQGPYVTLLKALGPEHEVGGWFEVVQPLVEKAGLTWRGQYSWDWQAHVGFSIGYAPAEREKLADVFMADFMAAFGRYPASVGSWLIDAHLLDYLHRRYGLVASCNCKDQWGTDGYTLWGGYWNQAYYPSRRNMFTPAQSAEGQVPVPVFRMLGSDPIYQYDTGFYGAENAPEGKAQGVVTLEPAYADGGGSPKWVRWFFDTMTQSPSLSFAYAQVGQENSFGWARMSAGLSDQVALLAEMAAAGEWRVETLETTGRWFRERFPVTPASAVVALNDWHGQGRRSAWFQSRFYRANVFWENERLRVRDIHLFDERYAERYLTQPCTTPNCTYDTLPVVEGMLWSAGTPASGGAGGAAGGTGAVWCGLVPMTRGGNGLGVPLHGGEPRVFESGTGGLAIRWPVLGDGDFTILCREGAMEFGSGLMEWWLEMVWAPGTATPFRAVEGNRLLCQHEGFSYAVECVHGAPILMANKNCLRFVPEGGKMTLVFERRT